MFKAAFHPQGGWLVTTGTLRLVEAWPMTGSPAIRLLDTPTSRVAFGPDGRWLVTASGSGTIRMWPLEGDRVGAPRTLFRAKDFNFQTLRVDDRGRRVFASVFDSAAGNGTTVIVSLEGGEVRSWDDAGDLELDPSGRWVAISANFTNGAPVHVFDSATERISEFGTMKDRFMGFASGGRLLTVTGDSLFSWDVESRERQLLETGIRDEITLCPDRETLLLRSDDGGLLLHRIGEPDSRRLPAKVPPGRIVCSTIAPGCSLLAFGRIDGDVVVVRTSTGELYSLPLLMVPCSTSPWTHWGDGSLPRAMG